MSRGDISAPAARVLFAGGIAGASCAALANVAVSALDHPVAFRDPGGWLAPLAVSFLLFTFFIVPATFAMRRLVAPRGFSAAAASLAVGAFATLLGVLFPVVLVLSRDLSFGGAGVVGVLAVLASAGLAWSVTVGVGAAARYTHALALGGPIAAGLALVLLLRLTTSAPASPLPDVSSPPPWALADEAPPAVLLLTVDTLRADFARNAAGPRTPALDALMADSVVFENARSPAPWTKPAVASLLTGLSPLVHGATAFGHALPSGVETLAETLGAAGYATGGIGHNDHLDSTFAFDQGFDEYAFPARGDVGLSFGSLLLSRLWPARFPERFVSTEAIAQVAADWIRRNHGRPFFLWVHVLDPHVLYAPPAHLSPADGPGSWGDEQTVTWVQAGILKLGDDEREQVRDLYRAEVRFADEAIGRVLETLKEFGLYDRALIAFTSDHGEEFWEHGGFEHGHSLFDEVLRVPLAFKLPGSTSRGRVEVPVSTESLTPTLVELLGRPVSAGRYTSPSLAGLVRAGGGQVEAAPLFASGTFYHSEKQMALVHGRFKLVLDTETGRRDLYDLVEDPAERDSIAASRPALLAEASRALRARVAEADEIGRTLGIDEPGVTPLDAGMRARLRALGYLGREE